jgi:uncharacterized protein
MGLAALARMVAALHAVAGVAGWPPGRFADRARHGVQVSAALGTGPSPRGHDSTVVDRVRQDRLVLEMRTECERCRTALQPDSEARICSYECTFCSTCADELTAVCPNCGGELVRRPRRVTG